MRQTDPAFQLPNREAPIQDSDAFRRAMDQLGRGAGETETAMRARKRQAEIATRKAFDGFAAVRAAAKPSDSPAEIRAAMEVLAARCALVEEAIEGLGRLSYAWLCTMFSADGNAERCTQHLRVTCYSARYLRETAQRVATELAGRRTPRRDRAREMVIGRLHDVFEQFYRKTPGGGAMGDALERFVQFALDAAGIPCPHGERFVKTLRKHRPKST